MSGNPNDWIGISYKRGVAFLDSMAYADFLKVPAYPLSVVAWIEERARALVRKEVDGHAEWQAFAIGAPDAFTTERGETCPNGIATLVHVAAGYGIYRDAPDDGLIPSGAQDWIEEQAARSDAKWEQVAAEYRERFGEPPYFLYNHFYTAQNRALLAARASKETP